MRKWYKGPMTDDDDITPLDQLLSTAVFSGQRNEVLTLLALGASPVWKDAQGTTALHYAAERDDAGILADLLSSPKAAADVRDDDNATPLHFAARKGRQDSIRLLLAKNAAVNAQDKWGAGALFRAAHNGQTVAVELLLKNGATVNLPDNKGHTALLAAVQRVHLLTAYALVRAGADANLANDNGLSPLDLATRLGQNVQNQFELTQFLTAVKLQGELVNGATKAIRPIKTVSFKKPGA